MDPELDAFVGVTGVCTQLGWSVRLGKDICLGTIGCPEDRIFDLASLTKPLGTATAFSILIERGVLGLDDPVKRWIPEAPSTLGARPLMELLNHRAGLAAWLDLGKDLSGSPTQRLNGLRQAALNAPLASIPGTKAVYSDLGYILAAWIAERAGQEVDDVRSTLGWDELFVVGSDAPPSPRSYAPTGFSPEGTKLQGQVHDDNCRAAGGKNTGHAGWFGTISGVTKAVSTWHDLLVGRHNKLPATASQLVKGIPGERTPGFDVPTPGGSTGGHWGQGTVGHLGFTGTAFWIDPVKDRSAVLLTNRTFPDGEDRGINVLRQWFFDWAAKL